MDVILSSKPQTLTLSSSFSFSSSNSSPSPSPFSHRICSLQREFLGCNHRFRPPRRKCKKLEFQIQIQIQPCRFNFRASLASQPVIIVVALATISALTVIYLNYTRRKHELKQVSGHKDADSLKSIEKSKQGTDSLKQGTESGIWDHHKLNVDISVVKRKALIGKMGENGHVSGNGHASEEKEVQYQTAAALNLETLATKASGLHMLDASSNILASNGVGAVSTKEPEGMGLILPPQLHGELDRIESLSSQVGLAEFISEGLEEAELGSKLPRLIDDPVSSASDIHVEHSPGETNQDYKPDHETVEGMHHQVSDYKGFFRESLREELHTFYEENHPGVSSISNSRNVKVMSPSSFLHCNSLSSRPSMLNGTEFSAQDSLRTSVSVYLEGKTSLACYHKDGKDLNKVTNIGKVFPPQNSQRDLHGLPQLTGRHDNAKHDKKEYFKTYNRLLREGRLADCIELLESMEQRGLLDMDKVYHVKFFNTCKNQKAVNEAFRFTKLIGNPTLSTFNMLLSVCASSQDSEGAFQVLQLVKQAGLKADCKLYTTLISTCAKCGKVDAMFEVFHEMVNVGIEPNLHTYGALIDGCARAGQVAKAFGAYGILRSKKVKPDRVVFNALITACGQSGAVQRAFDVLAEMRAEPTPVDPDHVTVGALIKTCVQAGQFDRAREVYNMLHQYNIKGTPEVYTIAVNSCSKIGDLDFALSIYRDMTRNGVVPDEMFLSALMDIAGHAGKADVALEFLQEARNRGAQLGKVAYSSLMGACSNAKNWQKALEVYEDIKFSKLHPTVSTLNALVTALCDGDQLQKAVECLTEMKKLGVRPNVITYTVLLIASDKRDEVEIGSMLHSEAKKDGVVPNLIMCRCLIGMCSRRFQKAYSLGEQICSFESGKPQIDNKWTSLALAVYREIIVAGVLPTMEVFSLVLACLQFPHDTSLRDRLVENLRVSTDASRCSNLNSLLDGFGEYDPRSFSLLEEAASLGIVPCVSFKERPIIVDARKLHIHTAEVYLLTVLKGLKHRLAAGAKLPNINIILPVEKIQVLTPEGEKTIKLAGRVGQAVGALLRRLGLPYQGNESFGKIRINGISVKRWFQPKLRTPFGGKPTELNSSQMRLAKGITDQQRNIRMSNFSLESDAK